MMRFLPYRTYRSDLSRSSPALSLTYRRNGGTFNSFLYDPTSIAFSKSKGNIFYDKL